MLANLELPAIYVTSQFTYPAIMTYICSRTNAVTGPLFGENTWHTHRRDVFRWQDRWVYILACTKLDTEFFWGGEEFWVMSAKIFQIEVLHFTLVTELTLGGMISSRTIWWFRHSYTGCENQTLINQHKKRAETEMKSVRSVAGYRLCQHKTN